jgi:O-antigen/teichoic acid export membrane protein
VIVLAANIAGNIALIPYLGLEGAALATTLSMIISAVLVPVMARNLVGVRL